MMKRKEDLTMTNKEMLVAELRKEQEQNRILRIELQIAKSLETYLQFVWLYNTTARTWSLSRTL